MSWHRLIPMVTVLVLGSGPHAWAGPPTDQLRTYTDQVLKILQSPSMTLADRREAVRNLAEEVFDVTETAKRALGQHWLKRTPAERDEFVKLFANLLEQTYINRIDEFGGERLTYVSEQIEGDRAIVRAKITTKNGTDVPVESRVLLKDNRWLIYDILIENLSLISNYRAQFDRVIRTASYDELVTRLKNKGEFLNEKGTKTPKKGEPVKR